NLNFLNAFLPEDVSNLRGLANGTITLSGNVDQPKLKGKLDFQNGGIKVGMLNTEYFFGGIVSITEDMIAFDNIPISDIKGNLGSAQGTILHKNFENWNFNCLLEFNKMLCMNTTEEMNPLYFGRAYATGSLEVFAYGNNIEVTVNAKTEKGTRITLPLYGSSDQSIQDFVKFVDRDSVVTMENDKLDLSGITLNFDFDITPDAEVFIVFDKLAGDMMRGRGAGHLQMLIDPLGEFTMFGQYVIDQGDYLFTLMNVINKRFSVRKGSTISWYGDPMAADIDLKAVYKVMAAPTEIMAPDVAALYKRNMEVECEMTLRQNLFKPDVAFDIRIPKGDENVKTALNGIRSSGPELTRQFFALMAINKFLPLTNSISNASGNALSGGKSTVSEMISSQMSNWLSQISDEFDIGLNYRPGDEISSEEIAVAFSTQLLNDRLTVSTNVGVAKGNSANRNPNQLIGDFNVEYKINKDGTFRVRGYNESNEFDITRTAQAPFTQGVGVYYTEEFDKLSDVKLLRKIRSWFRKKEDYKHHDDNSESRVPDQKGEPCLAEEPRLQKK
ncbi:MAG TPA: translocation/assembly module TamB domain-containing protein, partial [Flavobacteriales bacterium]|nr:translocation/assembly module TamB domain-containing protein [Flavobacteriales bacterium]